ncbi:SoxR reducing system RseC family protein [Pseudoalteromonas fenneropenaei]|uniref:SoxR reducing system RseC family protein n=1 Tax=Pseudoalteromonas fenneropenaei TaxID=1737459 RepID=A0ABV7CH29_9GAMM
MIEQTMTVVAVNGRLAELQAEAKKPCDGCNGKCGSQVFSKLFKTDKKTLSFEFDEAVVVGQKVKLALDDRHLVQHSLYVYLLPLLLALVAAMLSASVLALAEGWQIMAAIAGGLIGAGIAKIRTQRFKHDIQLLKIYPISLPLTQIDGD